MPDCRPMAHKAGFTGCVRRVAMPLYNKEQNVEVEFVAVAFLID
jgi:hypothetical protein